jgi:DNA topoisomerase-2
MAPTGTPPSEAAAFRKLEHREHVLLRPDMYIGSIQTEPVSAWLLRPDEAHPPASDAVAEGGPPSETGAAVRGQAQMQMQRRTDVAYCPGLLKVFDEIVVNAIDHATRSREQLRVQMAASKQTGAAAAAASIDPTQVVKKLEVTIDATSGVLEVANDGDGIPVEKAVHADGMYVPELIFGHLLTSANYDDEGIEPGGEGGSSEGKKGGGSGRTVGGQNGIGAKACNILSKWFEIEVIDRRRHLRYRQRWEDNMSRALPPVVEKCAAKKARTIVRWLPDYGRFGSDSLTPDMCALMVRRVVDACAVTEPDVAVWLNGAKLDVKSFERYVELFPGVAGNKAYERPADGWEVAASIGDGGGLQQVNFSQSTRGPGVSRPLRGQIVSGPSRLAKV